MSAILFVLGLLAGVTGAVFFLGANGVAALQGGILLVVGAVFIGAAAIMEEIATFRRHWDRRKE